MQELKFEPDGNFPVENLSVSDHQNGQGFSPFGDNPKYLHKQNHKMNAKIEKNQTRWKIWKISDPLKVFKI